MLINGNWLVVKQSLWNIWVSWDDDIPNRWNNKIHVPNHQPGNIFDIWVKLSTHDISNMNESNLLIALTIGREGS